MQTETRAKRRSLVNKMGLQTKMPVSLSVCVCVCVRKSRERGAGRENKQENRRTYVSSKAFRKQQGYRDLLLGMSISLDLKKKKKG